VRRGGGSTLWVLVGISENVSQRPPWRFTSVCGSRMKMNERKAKSRRHALVGFEMRQHIFLYVDECLNTHIGSKMSERYSYIQHFCDSSGTFNFETFGSIYYKKANPSERCSDQ
jgi:hypothetical protein